MPDVIKQEHINTVDGTTLYVSTVELFCDHGFGDTPLWYETMVFPKGSWLELHCERYTTKEQAIDGHARIIEAAKRGDFVQGATNA